MRFATLRRRNPSAFICLIHFFSDLRKFFCNFWVFPTKFAQIFIFPLLSLKKLSQSFVLILQRFSRKRNHVVNSGNFACKVVRKHAGPIYSLYVFRDVNLLKGCQASREEEGRARGINKAGRGGGGVNSAIFKYRYMYTRQCMPRVDI
jgi:hypothetical protein